MKTVKGITYFPTFVAARQWAESNLGVNGQWRIVEYDLGHRWAIQLRKSGPYMNAETKEWA